MSDGILQTSIELGLAALALGGGAGGAIAALRAGWRMGGHFGADLDYRVAALNAQRDIELARAATAQAIPPAHYAPHVTYSPHISSQVTSPNSGPGTVADQGKEAAPIPSFAQLLESGRVGKGNPLVLGYTGEGALYGKWEDLYSVGIGGKSGSGKSWTAVFLLCQSMLLGSHVALIDPHAGNDESMTTRLSPMKRTGRYLCEPAQDPKDIQDTVRLITGEVERRERAGRRRAELTPWVVVLDEYSTLMRGELVDLLGGMMEYIAQVGRKYNVFAMALGHIWKGTRTGGTEMRDSLASAYIHRIAPAQARYLTGLTADDLPGGLLELPAGSGYLLSTRGELTRVTIPQMSSDDLARVAGLLTDDAPTMPRLETPEKPERNQHDTEGKSVSGASEAVMLTPEERRIADLFFIQGLDVGQIVKELNPGKALKGTSYQQAAKPVQEAIRKAGSLVNHTQ